MKSETAKKLFKIAFSFNFFYSEVKGYAFFSWAQTLPELVTLEVGIIHQIYNDLGRGIRGNSLADSREGC